MQWAAIVCLDNLFLATPLVAELRQALTAGVSLPPENVMLACTHTHRAPYTAAIMDEEIDYDYVDFLRARLADCMAKAFASLQPAVCRVGHIQAPGWTFNRRQVYRSARYGEQVGTQGPQSHPDFLGNEGP